MAAGRVQRSETRSLAPWPPPGPSHRYRFTLYALDRPLELDVAASKEQVLDAMQGHILGQGQLTGLYQS
ncbi:MAG: YbhB/YbcL family Raf kinase inhibitor-like protein [Dehalococcoidia bacterium]|nr:MAG: YbhB/YbcL family Raf kinase inhibitor-like protein [Dehalococcoidia bacterium]